VIVDKKEKEDQKLAVIEKITSCLTEKQGINQFFAMIISLLDEYLLADIYFIVIKDDEKYRILEQYSKLNIQSFVNSELDKNIFILLQQINKMKKKSMVFEGITGLFKKSLGNETMRLNSLRFIPVNDTDFLIGINPPHKKYTQQDIEYMQTIIQLLNYYITSCKDNAYIFQQEKIEKNLLHYFSPTLISKLTHDYIEEFEETEVDVVILFIDVRNFVTLTEKRSSKETIDLLNTYLRKIVNIIIQNYGSIDKYIGDAVCAYWGFPQKHKNDSLLAVLTALAIQGEINSLKTKGLLPKDFFVGIGIHKGPAIIGNIGAEERLEVSLIGDSVLIAEDVCDAAPPDEILITNNMVQDIKHYASFEQFDYSTINTKKRKIPLYRIDLLRENYYDILMKAM
jgi:class 3 adenylate cyclase